MASGKTTKETTKETKVKKKTTKKPSQSKSHDKKHDKKGFWAKLGAYFKGSWQELKKVQWPDKKATWSLTIAVLVFTAFFVVIILLIDIIFQELFNMILAR